MPFIAYGQLGAGRPVDVGMPGPEGPVGPEGPTGAPGGSDASFADWINDTTPSQTRAALTAAFQTFVPVTRFGALTDGATTDATIAAALAATADGTPLYFPTGVYKTTQPIQIIGDNRMIRCADGVEFRCNGTDAAVILSGYGLDVDLGLVAASWDGVTATGNYALRYYNLSRSRVRVRTVGKALTAGIFHDAASQTQNEGNNVWEVVTLNPGTSCPAGMQFDSHATYTSEGDAWDVKVLFPSDLNGLIVGTVGKNTVRWNEFHVSVDSQASMDTLFRVNNDGNALTLRTWQGLPGGQHVIFAAGTKNNFLISQPGVQGALNVIDNGTNVSLYPNRDGEYEWNIGAGTQFIAPSTTQAMRLLQGNNATDSGGALGFGIAALKNNSVMALIKGVLASATGTELQGGIAFQTRPTGAAGQALTERMRITAAGALNVVTGPIQVAGIQVVAARQTGWTAMTGTSDKSTAFATSTVTLAQLAGRVMALQAALTTHGLIGA